MLDTDRLLDRLSGEFLPVRSPDLNALFKEFDDAHSAAADWVRRHCPSFDCHRLAIVPASFDSALQRHIMIYGVLCDQP